RRQVPERANKQQRADDERQRQRDLRNDEDVAQPEALVRVGGPAAANLHRRRRIHPRGTKRRHDSENYARYRRAEPDEREYAPVGRPREDTATARRRD